MSVQQGSDAGLDAEPARPHDDHVAGRRTASRRRNRRVLGIMFIVASWGGIASYLALGAATSLERAEQLIPAAGDAVRAADDREARIILEEARSELAAAASALDHPLVKPFRLLPAIGKDLRAATAIADGGASVTDAVTEAMAAIDSLPGGMQALGPVDGALPVAAIERLAPSLRLTADAAAEALRRIELAPGSGRIDRISAGRERVLGLLVPLAPQAESAAQLAAQLPAFLGVDGPRTYLFGASTPAELRGTGGLIGSVSLLRIEDGRPEFGRFLPGNDLPVLAPDAIPPPVSSDAARWSRYGGTGNWLTVNRTPHFPAAAQVMMEHWEITQGDVVDGFIVADPFALEALLGLAGTAEVPGYDVRLDADSVVDFVANEAYARFESEDERKEVLGAVSAATLQRFLEAGSDAAPISELFTALGGLAREGHVLAYAKDADVQAAFSRAGLAGELLDPDGDLVNVVINNGSANKVDYYTDRRIDHEVTLLRDGAARSELRVGITNGAPTSGPPSYVIGPNNASLDAGDSLVDISVYLARDAAFDRVPPAEAGLPAFTETEMGHPVHDGWARIPSEGGIERSYGWRTANAWSVSPEGMLEYDVLFQGQTVIRPTELAVRVNVPAGFELLEGPDGARLDGDALTWSKTIRGEDVTLRIRLRPLSDT